MHIAYTYTESDFVRAGMLMLKKRSPLLLYFRWLGVALLTWFVVSLMIDPAVRATLAGPSAMFRVGFGLFMPIFFLSIPFLTRRNLRKQFRQTPLLSERRSLEFDDFGYQSKSASAQVQVAWTAYIGIMEDKYNFLLVQQGKMIYVPIPKSPFTPVEVDELRSMFERHLPRK